MGEGEKRREAQRWPGLQGVGLVTRLLRSVFDAELTLFCLTLAKVLWR